MGRPKGAFSFDDGRLKLYEKGWTDAEIAEKMFLHQSSIYGWRTRRGLPPNGGSGRGGLRVHNKRHAVAMGRA